MVWPFSRKPKASAESKDMRNAPVDSPLDFREDGSIRPGDPAWAVMMEVMKSGKPVISTQRPDGTWDSETVED